MHTPIKDARKMNKNATTIMLGALFSSMILPVMTQQQNADARLSITNYVNAYNDGEPTDDKNI
jgi:hypothetical protein